MAIFGHSKFIPFLAIPNLYQSFKHFLGNIVRKRLEQPFLAIPNLYQSFWEKLLEKMEKNSFGKGIGHIGTAIFGHSKFMPFGKKENNWNNHFWPNLYQSFWEKLLAKKWETLSKRDWPFLAIPNLYQSFWGNIEKKLEHPFLEIYTMGKIVRKRLEQAFFAIPDLYQFFWEKFSEKNWNNHIWPFLIYTSPFWETLLEKIGHFWPFQIYTSLLGNIVRKRLNKHFWPFLIYTSLSGKNCWKKLEQPFLAIPNLYQSFWETLSEKDWNKPFFAIPNLYQFFWEKLSEKIGTTIFGHSKFIPVFLGKIVGKNSEWPFLAIPNFTSLEKNCWKKI